MLHCNASWRHTGSAAVVATALPATLLAVTRQVSCGAVVRRHRGVARRSRPGDIHAVAAPLQRNARRRPAAPAPGIDADQAPILPLPLSAGAVTSAGATATTLSRKLAAALPPELLAVTVTVAAETSVAVGRLTTPVAASIVAPPPETA